MGGEDMAEFRLVAEQVFSQETDGQGSLIIRRAGQQRRIAVIDSGNAVRAEIFLDPEQTEALVKALQADA
jgi:hypothetical protein